MTAINQNLKIFMLLNAMSVLLCLMATSYSDAYAFFLGSTWGTVNFYLIGNLVKHVLITKSQLQMIIGIALKFPILYYVGYQFLKLSWLNPLFLVIGFSSNMIIMIALFLIYKPMRIKV